MQNIRLLGLWRIFFFFFFFLLCVVCDVCKKKKKLKYLFIETVVKSNLSIVKRTNKKSIVLCSGVYEHVVKISVRRIFVTKEIDLSIAYRSKKNPNIAVVSYAQRKYSIRQKVNGYVHLSCETDEFTD